MLVFALSLLYLLPSTYYSFLAPLLVSTFCGIFRGLFHLDISKNYSIYHWCILYLY